ncbi:MAG: hypothetical protein NVSMB64_15350 [Candidatus Velthaea sp.]
MARYAAEHFADNVAMSAFITVTDAAGRVLFRRPATDAEVLDAVRAAEAAEVEAKAAMDRIAAERTDLETHEAELG